MSREGGFEVTPLLQQEEQCNAGNDGVDYLFYGLRPSETRTWSIQGLPLVLTTVDRDKFDLFNSIIYPSIQHYIIQSRTTKRCNEILQSLFTRLNTYEQSLEFQSV